MGYVTHHELNFSGPQGERLPLETREEILRFVDEQGGFDGLREEADIESFLLGDAKWWEEDPVCSGSHSGSRTSC